MQLDDTQPCGGMTNFGALIGLCVACARRTRTVAAPMLPPAQQDNLTGEWSCVERRFAGHGHKVVDLAQTTPPDLRGPGLQSFIKRGDAR